MVRGGRGADGRGGHGSLVPSPHHVLLLWCLLPGLQEGQGLQIGLLVALLGSTMGWLCGTTTSTSAADEDLDEEEMDLVRTEGPGLPPLECSSAAKVQSFIKESRPR